MKSGFCLVSSDFSCFVGSAEDTAIVPGKQLIDPDKRKNLQYFTNTICDKEFKVTITANIQA